VGRVVRRRSRAVCCDAVSLHKPGEKFYNFQRIREEIVADTERQTGRNAGARARMGMALTGQASRRSRSTFDSSRRMS